MIVRRRRKGWLGIIWRIRQQVNRIVRERAKSGLKRLWIIRKKKKKDMKSDSNRIVSKSCVIKIEKSGWRSKIRIAITRRMIIILL